MQASVETPSNWKSFMRIDENKSVLFHCRATYITYNNISGKVILNTFNDTIKVTTDVEHVEEMNLCNHEKADMRIFLDWKVFEKYFNM